MYIHKTLCATVAFLVATHALPVYQGTFKLIGVISRVAIAYTLIAPGVQKVGSVIQTRGRQQAGNVIQELVKRTDDADEIWSQGKRSDDADEIWSQGKRSDDADEIWSQGKRSDDSDEIWSQGKRSDDADEIWSQGKRSDDADEIWSQG
ncbi:hypothetical protein MMC18_000248 [Xylographa bjoerkii]|nr:hypothetical protein [Xylographa bjoerkii]